MPPDPAAVREMLAHAVPFARLLGLEFDVITKGRSVVRLPDRPDLHNHLGGPHAGALFTLGETASGAAMLSVYSDVLGRAVPVAAGAEIRYRRMALGEVTAEAVLGRPREEVLVELDGGATPRIPVAVTLHNAAGEPTAEMTVTWALRPI